MVTDYNEYGQERYDELARQFTTAQGEQGPQGDTPILTDSAAILSGRYVTTWSGSSTEIARCTFAPGELSPTTDSISIQVWPTTETAVNPDPEETVSVVWSYGSSTTLYSMPTNNIGGYCWYGWISQFSDSTKADVLYIDPGYTPGQNLRVTGPFFNAISISNNWMSTGGSLIFYANRIVFPAPASVEFRTIIKVWKIVS